MQMGTVVPRRADGHRGMHAVVRTCIPVQMGAVGYVPRWVRMQMDTTTQVTINIALSPSCDYTGGGTLIEASG